jgi:ABC-type glycerol-3-phosphate transport system substrate-binding protein
MSDILAMAGKPGMALRIQETAEENPKVRGWYATYYPNNIAAYTWNVNNQIAFGHGKTIELALADLRAKMEAKSGQS